MKCMGAARAAGTRRVAPFRTMLRRFVGTAAHEPLMPLLRHPE